MKVHSNLFFIKSSCSIIKHTGTVQCFRSLLVITTIFLLWSPTTYSQNEVGDIHGKLTDRKLGKPIANHPVTLKIHKARDDTQQETKTDENGNYRFENLPLDVETHYTVSTTHDGIEYTEKDLVLSSWVPSLPVHIDVNNLTDDPSQIHVKTYSIAIGFTSEDDIKEGILSIFEVFVVENKGVLSFQTTQNNEEAGLYFALPKGHKMFKSLGPETLKINSAADHAVVTDPVRPGELEGGFAYTFHTTRRNIKLSRPMYFHTDQISILVPEGIRIVPRSKLFKQVGRTQFHNIVYTKYEASPEGGFPIGKAPDLSLVVSGQQFNRQESNIGQMAFIAIAAALAGGFLVAAIFMLRRAQGASEESDDIVSVSTDTGWLRKLNDADLEHARTARLEFITLLDGAHEKQDISERVYNRLRKEQTERLTEILDQCKERGINI